jgi:hypothetical protein
MALLFVHHPNLKSQLVSPFFRLMIGPPTGHRHANVSIFSVPLGLFEIDQLPLQEFHVLADDVGGMVITDELEIAVIQRQPSILDLFDRHRQGIEPNAPGCFIHTVPGIALNKDLHIPSKQQNPAS